MNADETTRRRLCMDEDPSLDEALRELSAAEDFLEYFIDYDPHVVQVNRLHILQRFHDYITKAGPVPAQAAEAYDLYARLLRQAYEDFMRSDALTEKVFKVFHMHGPHTAVVPLSALRVAGRTVRIENETDRGCGGEGVYHSSAAALKSVE